MKKIFCIAVSLCAVAIVNAQVAATDSTLFDFWVGDWDATWKNPDGSESHGRNTITRHMDGKIIKESFSALDGPAKGYKGESYSVLEKRSQQWKQTWIDNGGGYLDFTGTVDGDTRIFERTTTFNGKTIKARMRFYNISPDRFSWDWETSADEGKTWKLNWRIQYTRRK
jgi:hypothetical protein